MHDKLRDPFSGLSHLAAAIAAALGLGLLLYFGRNSLSRDIALLIYGMSLVLMFSASATYHLVKTSERATAVLRRFDHTSIYLLIAGTYTPVCLQFFSGGWKWGILITIWAMAVIGIVVKIFFINAPRWLTAGIYLLMGWLAIVAIKQMLATMPVGALLWLLAGGIFFTLGAVIYITKWPDFIPHVFGFHEVWHIFVILGCLSHFILILQFVAIAA